MRLGAAFALDLAVLSVCGFFAVRGIVDETGDNETLYGLAWIGFLLAALVLLVLLGLLARRFAKPS